MFIKIERKRNEQSLKDKRLLIKKHKVDKKNPDLCVEFMIGKFKHIQFLKTRNI